MILKNDKIKDLLEKYPQLKESLMKRNSKFKKLNNPVVFKLVSKWARIKDIAKVGREDLDELLIYLNKEVGIKVDSQILNEIKDESIEELEHDYPEWFLTTGFKTFDVREFSDDPFNAIMDAVKEIAPQEGLEIVQSFLPTPLLKVLEKKGFEYYSVKDVDDKFHVFFYNTTEKEVEVEKMESSLKPGWMRIVNFDNVLDVRGEATDPFNLIMEFSDKIGLEEGFKLIQTFNPTPLIPILEGKGFLFYTDKISDTEYHVYFYRKEIIEVASEQIQICKHEDDNPYANSDIEKISVVLQSATPIAIPVFAVLKKSKKLQEYFDFKEIKVWEKTEKHLGWIVNGKADISFSAVISQVKLFLNGVDAQLATVDVWDNFKILSSEVKEKGTFSALKNTTIHMPLLKAAPPYGITSYLMQKEGLNPDDFKIAYGAVGSKGFGRPEEIAEELVAGDIKTALLREPEASFALFGQEGKIEELFNYGEIWEKYHDDLKSLPNAGVLFKGELIRKYPEHVKVFLDELNRAIEWINKNPRRAATYCYRDFNRSIESVEFFIKRAMFKHTKAQDLKEELRKYLQYMVDLGLLTLKSDTVDMDFILDYDSL